MKTFEPYLIGLLTILGSYLVAISVNYLKNKKKDSLNDFKPFNLKKHGRKQD
jgi:hypothetical protein